MFKEEFQSAKVWSCLDHKVRPQVTLVEGGGEEDKDDEARGQPAIRAVLVVKIMGWKLRKILGKKTLRSSVSYIAQRRLLPQR